MSEIVSSTMDLKDLILKLFTNPPQNKHSFGIELENANEAAETEEAKNKILTYKNNLLMTIFINGSRILFGEAVTPANISETQFNLLNRYMESIGYTCNYEYVKNEDNVNTNINIWFEYIKKFSEQV
jgi:hypothetical protein